MELTDVVASEASALDQHENLELLAPDFSGLGDPLGNALPFVLWTVGDQPLLDHWLDFALDEGCRRVHIYTSDRPHKVREHLAEKADFWPIEIRLFTVRSDRDSAAGARAIFTLPSLEALPVPQYTDPYDLLNHWQALERGWLDTVLSADEENSKYIALGSGCQVHPSARILMPACIGDNVSIGPGCVVGPYAVVDSGAVLSGGNILTHSHVSQDTYLGPDTELDNAVLVRNRLTNLRLRTSIELVDAFLADSMRPEKRHWSTRVFGRIEAILVFLILSIFHARIQKKSPFLYTRKDLLKRVLAGRLSLYGKPSLGFQNASDEYAELRDALGECPEGFFSYADAQGAHELEDPATFLHLMYASSLPRKFRDSACRRALWKRLLS